MWNDTKILMKNRNYVLTTICFSFVYGVYAAIGFVISPLLDPLGYGLGMIAAIVMITVIVGSFSVIITGKFLDKSNKYLLTLKLICIGASVSLASGLWTVEYGTLWGGIVWPVLIGVTITPVLTVCFALGTESTHPVQPALVTGLMMSIA